jgi:hypothetical protein
VLGGFDNSTRHAIFHAACWITHLELDGNMAGATWHDSTESLSDFRASPRDRGCG